MTPLKRVQFDEREKQLLIGVLVACGILFVVVLLLGWYVLDVKRNSAEVLTDDKTSSVIRDTNNQKIEAKTDAERIVKLVGKHMSFPEGEVVVASITDVELLRQKNPIFFQFAKAGDKLLLYANGIILYDEAADKIIDVWRIIPTPRTP